MKVREALPSDAAAIAKVHVDAWRSTYHGVLSAEFLEGLSYEQRKRVCQVALDDHRGGNFIHVAEDDRGKIVGFVACGREREQKGTYEGEIYAIYLLAEHQGKGWGKRLFQEAAERLVAEGMHSMMLWVLAENPTRGFYEALGGAALDAKDIEIGGATLVEVAYGWDSLEAIVSAG